MNGERLLERLHEAIREALRTGKHPHVINCTSLPGGTTEIEGEFDLSIIVRACLREIEAAGFRVLPMKPG